MWMSNRIKIKKGVSPVPTHTLFPTPFPWLRPSHCPVDKTWLLTVRCCRTARWTNPLAIGHRLPSAWTSRHHRPLEATARRNPGLMLATVRACIRACVRACVCVHVRVVYAHECVYVRACFCAHAHARTGICVHLRVDGWVRDRVRSRRHWSWNLNNITVISLWHTEFIAFYFSSYVCVSPEFRQLFCSISCTRSDWSVLFLFPCPLQKWRISFSLIHLMFYFLLFSGMINFSITEI